MAGERGRAAPDTQAPLAPADRMVVMVGSASPVTAEQIAYAEQYGFASIALDAARLADSVTRAAVSEGYCRWACGQLEQGASVVLYSARGPPADAGDPDRSTLDAALGEAQGLLLRMILQRSYVRWVCVAGGDTSSRVVQQLGIGTLTVAARVAPGARQSSAHAPCRPFDGLAPALKGGQVGGIDYFTRVRDGG